MRHGLGGPALPLQRAGQRPAGPSVRGRQLDQPGERLLRPRQLGRPEVGAGEHLQRGLVRGLCGDDALEDAGRLAGPAHGEEEVGPEELRVQVDLERLTHERPNDDVPASLPAAHPHGHLRQKSRHPTSSEELAMQLRHSPHQRTTNAGRSAPGDGDRTYDPRVFAVQRVGAVAVAVVILVFGVLGFAGGLGFFSTEGQPVLGMSSNGLLSTVSVLTAVVLLAAALRGPRVASTVMIVVGTLFLVSALANLAVLRTSFNVLAFEMTNVAFSVVAGLVLLLLGAYGRLTGNVPADSPYAHPAEAVDDEPDEYPSTPAEFAAERSMRDAEIAVVNHVATADQRRRVAARAQVTSRPDRRRVWMEFDGLPS